MSNDDRDDGLLSPPDQVAERGPIPLHPATPAWLETLVLTFAQHVTQADPHIWDDDWVALAPLDAADLPLLVITISQLASDGQKQLSRLIERERTAGRAFFSFAPEAAEIMREAMRTLSPYVVTHSRSQRARPQPADVRIPLWLQALHTLGEDLAAAPPTREE